MISASLVELRIRFFARLPTTFSYTPCAAESLGRHNATPCFLLFHFEENEVIFGCSSSHAFGFVHLVWRPNEVLPFSRPSFEQDVRWDLIGEHLLETPNMSG